MKALKSKKEKFITGFLNGSTPFSAKRKEMNKEIYNPLRLKSEHLLNACDFENENIFDSICFIGGGIAGTIMAPVDAVITIYGNIKETFKIK